MRKLKKNKGFTMAEVLIVVAIMMVLFGVVFIGVFQHMRSLAQLERDTIAKEIFVAAQNHLTAAEGQGYLNLDSSAYGTKGDSAIDKAAKAKDIRYFIVDKGSTSYGSLLELMLPFGAIDETVRAGGSYIIRYQPSPATVLDVFYSSPNERFGYSFGSSDYNELFKDDTYTGDGNKMRQKYGTDRSVIGWYGGESPLAAGERLKVPEIEIINAERLQVKVTDNNTGDAFSGMGVVTKLIIEGVTSEAKKAILLDESVGRVQKSGNVYTVILDDITKGTSGFHFCELNDSTTGNIIGQFLPGEDIKIYAIAYSTSTLTNIAKCPEGITNSLFGYDKSALAGEAQISNFRHLENLSTDVSKVSYESAEVNGGKITSAKQTSDLIWTGAGTGREGFVEKIGSEEIHIYGPMGGQTSNQLTKTGCYYPVSVQNGVNLAYNGDGHSISNVKVDYAGDAGIFGSLTGGSVSSLLVLDSEIKSTDGNAGGLIGSMTGTTVTGCAASAIVKNTGGTGEAGEKGNAGGLIGMAGGGTVTASYSGGQTVDKTGAYSKEKYNVSGTDTAGGLIGRAAGTTVQSCYSTCSASGATAGGLIGRLAEDSSVSDCYAVGLVSGTTNAGALLGTATGTISGNNYYYEIINELPGNGNNGISYLGPVNNTSNAYVSAIDTSAASYNSFVGDPSNWNPAVPYDSALKNYYQGKYNLQTISQLLGTETVDYKYFDTHYGDWPAPEIFIINPTVTGTGDATTDTSGNP